MNPPPSSGAEAQTSASPRDIVPINMVQFTQKVDNFLIIFDPSASMSIPYRNRTKFELAMDTTIHLNKTIPDLNLIGGLRTFGHPVYTSMIYGFADYSADAFENALLTIENADGVSPMEFALDATTKDMFSLTGKLAIIIISDGNGMDISPVLAARNLIKKYGERVCIYTILVGDDPTGAKILADIASESACGFTVNADSLVSGQNMADFVTKVFLTAAPPEDCPHTDTDCDGVENDKDDCPDTPKGLKVNARGCWEIYDVMFDFDKYVIKPVYFGVMDKVASVLKEHPEIKIRIDGHCDIIGSERYNDTLSINRANAGKTYLLNKGVPPEQIMVKGFGYTKPRDTNKTDEGRARNRRLEFMQVGKDMAPAP